MIRVGLIGAGFIGRNHFNQYEKMPERVTLIICDKEPDRREGDWSKVGGNIADSKGSKRDVSHLQRYSDWKQLIADPNVDAVDICVPTPLHKEITLAALLSGKHVLCEKPMALTVEDCDTMLAAAAKSKARFMVAQVIRFWPEYRFLRQIVENRRYGQLKALHLRRQAATPGYTLNNWVLNPKLSGGAVLDLHVHDVDFVLGLLGKPKAVCAQGHIKPNGSCDRIHAQWYYDAVPLVQLEGWWDMPGNFPFNMGFTAVFENGGVHWDMNTGKPLAVYENGKDPYTPEIPTEDGYYAEIDYFLSCIEQNRDPKLTTPKESRDAVALALAEQQSAETARQVEIT
ncbi:MAG TPA: Gfo/Idh/MocA family oxidoreductase [Phycisphaerae bacterium]|nr:Gfo/Idh/MocA family oxidoreductase [Phycisphaerae bacterium]HRR84672.1 Gfo/Idh/MocA family oxidoreductase [Phycisphaerae bacterium]